MADDLAGCPLTATLLGPQAVLKSGAGSRPEGSSVCHEHEDQIRSRPAAPAGSHPQDQLETGGIPVLQPIQDTEEIIQRIAALGHRQSRTDLLCAHPRPRPARASSAGHASDGAVERVNVFEVGLHDIDRAIRKTKTGRFSRHRPNPSAPDSQETQNLATDRAGRTSNQDHKAIVVAPGRSL